MEVSGVASRPVSWFVAALVWSAVTLGGCGVQPESTPTVLPAASTPPLVLPDAEADGAGDDGNERAVAAVSIYLVRDERLVHVTRDLGVGAGATETIESLLAGPTDAEAVAGLSTAIPPSTTLTAVEQTGTRVTVDLTSDFTAIGGIEEILAVGQLVLTLTESDGIDEVSFVIDGRATVVPIANGALTERPVSAEDYLTLLP